jgi:hypothetical protein
MDVISRPRWEDYDIEYRTVSSTFISIGMVISVLMQTGKSFRFPGRWKVSTGGSRRRFGILYKIEQAE